MISSLHPCSDPRCKHLADALVSLLSNEETEAQEGPCLRLFSWLGIEAGFKPRAWEPQAPDGKQQALSMKAAPCGQSNIGH